MKVLCLVVTLLLYTPSLLARPSFAEILKLSHSIVLITTQLPDGTNGRGSGVVVSPEYVATNCHVIANATGANVAKFRQAHRPIAIKADWRHDVCLLKFSSLPLPAVPLRMSETVTYEEPILTIGFPAGTNVPQPSYGEVKGTYPYEGSRVIRANAAFSLGSSGGALFDKAFNLLGITTFKSPGADGYFYSMPADWIQRLMDAPASIETTDLKTNEIPFWALPLNERPYFMQVVIPYQNKAWAELKTVASSWKEQEPDSADAWYFLGLAAQGLGNLDEAKKHFTQAYTLNIHDLDAMLALANVAYAQKDITALEALKTPITAIDESQEKAITTKIEMLQKQ
jgi:serine protease Do